MLESPIRSLLEEHRRRELDERRATVAASARPATGSTPVDDEPVEYLPYGATEERPEALCEVLATLGPVETEYASLRRGAGIMDCPHRGTLEVRGADGRGFLDRMLTAKLEGLAEGQVHPAFWLQRTGRIAADVLVIDCGDRVLIDLDVAQAEETARTLEGFVFAEDIAIRNCTADVHHVAVHGRDAIAVVAGAAAAGGWTIDDRRCAALTIDDVAVTVTRRDLVGGPGLLLLCPARGVERVVARLLAADEAGPAAGRRVRPIGWHAWNIARIEAGTPLFNVDFGPTNLPHETGVLDDRVSFAKGCYPGQEVVARMQNLGRPKQELVGLRIDGDGLPVAGGQVFEIVDDAMGQQVGVVTSSTLSPMLGAVPIAFAMLRSSASTDGTTVLVNAEGGQERAVVAPLRFWSGTTQEAGAC